VTLAELAPFLILIVVVAALYTSVGHGGASGYIAVLSLTALASGEISSTALTMNLLAAGAAFWAFQRGGHFRFKIVWPFLVTSIPAAYLGGTISISEKLYFLTLAGVLIYAAVRLVWKKKTTSDDEECQAIRLGVALPLGAAIGLLSGVIGVGGGIFLSPIILLMRWGQVKETAAASALFILINSAAGIGGRAVSGTYEPAHLIPLLAACGIGALIGSWAGAFKFQPKAVRAMLSAVLLIAAGKMVFKNFDTQANSTGHEPVQETKV
jgi:uncharacterized membrane protein YfcA